MEESRNANVMFNKNGNGSITTRIALPVPWVKALGFSQDDKSATIKIVDEKIIIEKNKKI